MGFLPAAVHHTQIIQFLHNVAPFLCILILNMQIAHKSGMSKPH